MFLSAMSRNAGPKEMTQGPFEIFDVRDGYLVVRGIMILGGIYAWWSMLGLGVGSSLDALAGAFEGVDIWKSIGMAR